LAIDVIIAGGADDDLREALHYYKRENEALAQYLEDRFWQAIERIEESPLAWPPFESGCRRFMLHRFPYFVVYLVEGERILVVAFAHTSRRPGYWLDPL
jgi:plasmid stabilization system protein ParE